MLTRRELLAQGSALLGGAALLGLPEWSRSAAANVARIADATSARAVPLPTPAHSGIDHFVVVMMENRSFDHFLGWLPGADGRQSGLHYLDHHGTPHATYHLTDFQGCAHPDPDHSWEGGRAEFNRGKCDGWLRAGSNDAFSIGYYEPSDLAFYSKAAPYWTVCDRYFAAIMDQAVTTSPQWSRTMLVITYDEWGGFFDHVRPPVAPDANPKARLRGFRVPCIVVSPRARRHHVAHNVYDHTSVLKAIEWRFGLAPLTTRDAHARNIMEVLDFAHAPIAPSACTSPRDLGVETVRRPARG